MAANNFTSDYLKERKMPLVFGLSFVFSFLMSLNLAMFIDNGGHFRCMEVVILIGLFDYRLKQIK